MKTSEYLQVNLPQILINWSKYFIRADYSDMSAYVQAKSVEYGTEQGIDKDMTKQQILEKLRVAFLVPNKILSLYKKRIQLNNKQLMHSTQEQIEEINEAIKYYNRF